MPTPPSPPAAAAAAAARTPTSLGRQLLSVRGSGANSAKVTQSSGVLQDALADAGKIAFAYSNLPQLRQENCSLVCMLQQQHAYVIYRPVSVWL
jgi:hypothetical protein